MRRFGYVRCSHFSMPSSFCFKSSFSNLLLDFCEANVGEWFSGRRLSRLCDHCSYSNDDAVEWVRAPFIMQKLLVQTKAALSVSAESLPTLRYFCPWKITSRQFFLPGCKLVVDMHCASSTGNSVALNLRCSMRNGKGISVAGE